MNGTTKHKYVAFGFIYLFALICAYFLSSLLCFSLFVVLAVLFLFVLDKDNDIKLYITLVALAFFISGLYKITVVESNERLIGSEGIVTGFVTDIRFPDNDTVLVEISGNTGSIPVKLTLFTTDAGFSIGDCIEVPVAFSDLRKNVDFDEELYYYSKGIFLKAYATDEIVVTGRTPSLRGIIADLNEVLKGRIVDIFPDERGGLIKAVFFGDKSGLSPKLSESIRRSGIAHLTAVSGMHITLMAQIGICCISPFFRRWNCIIPLISVAFVVILMLFFGLTYSVMRSGLMLLICYGSAILKRKSLTVKSLDGALLIILIPDPTACMDTGLWLSVLGTLGVSSVAPKVIKRLKIRKKRRFLRGFITSLCAMLVTAPVGAFCFGGISIMSAVTGFLVTPFFVLILITVPMGLILPFLFLPIFFISGISATAINKVSEILGGFGFSYFKADRELMTAFAVTASLLLLLFFIIYSISGYVVKAFLALTALFVSALSFSELLILENTIISVYSEGENGFLKVKTKKGISVFAVSDNDRISDMIDKYIIGEKPELICIASGEGNNALINSEKYGCTVHLPDNGNMTYDISGEYTAYVIDGEIVLDVNGVSIGLLNIENDSMYDIEILSGYRKNYTADENFATILCDKRFYNCEYLNAYYSGTEIIINTDGRVAIKLR